MTDYEGAWELIAKRNCAVNVAAIVWKNTIVVFAKSAKSKQMLNAMEGAVLISIYYILKSLNLPNAMTNTL